MRLRRIRDANSFGAGGIRLKPLRLAWSLNEPFFEMRTTVDSPCRGEARSGYQTVEESLSDMFYSAIFKWSWRKTIRDGRFERF